LSPQAAGASASGESIVDNGDPGFKSVGSWTSVPGDHNYKEEAVWAASTAATETPATATWTPDLKAAGLYDVYEWHGDDPTPTTPPRRRLPSSLTVTPGRSGESSRQ